MEDFSNKWKIEYETGIPEIDQQHKKLFNYIETLSIAIYSKSGKDELISLCRFLKNYIDTHFSTEEILMRQAHYPNLEQHMEVHRSFEEYYKIIEKELFEKGADHYLAIEIENKMHSWWKNHIIKMDMQYVPYFKDEKK